jgi:hypothetical protein
MKKNGPRSEAQGPNHLLKVGNTDCNLFVTLSTNHLQLSATASNNSDFQNMIDKSGIYP